MYFIAFVSPTCEYFTHGNHQPYFHGIDTYLNFCVILVMELNTNTE